MQALASRMPASCVSGHLARSVQSWMSHRSQPLFVGRARDEQAATAAASAVSMSQVYCESSAFWAFVGSGGKMDDFPLCGGCPRKRGSPGMCAPCLKEAGRRGLAEKVIEWWEGVMKERDEAEDGDDDACWWHSWSKTGGRGSGGADVAASVASSGVEGADSGAWQEDPPSAKRRLASPSVPPRSSREVGVGQLKGGRRFFTRVARALGIGARAILLLCRRIHWRPCLSRRRKLLAARMLIFFARSMCA